MTTPTNDVERAIASLEQRRDETAWLAFLEALEASPLYFPQPEAPEVEGARAAGADEEFSLAAVEQGGSTYVPAYTSVDQLRAGADWAPGYVAIPGEVFLSMVADGSTRVAVNYGAGRWEVVVDEHAIRMLASQRGVTETVPAGQQLMFGQPETEPTELLEAVAAAAEGRPAISALHRALVVIPPRTPELAIALEVGADADAEAERNAIGAAVVAAGGEAILVVVAPGIEGPMEGYFREHSTPFWRRS